MEAILEWVKGIVILMIVGNVLLYLVQGRSYEKYVQLFFQLLVIMAVIAPVGKVVLDKDTFFDALDYQTFWQNMDNIQRDNEKVEDLGRAYAKEQYEQAVEEDVLHMLERMEYEPVYVKASLDEDYTISSLCIGFREAGGYQEVLKEVTEYYQLEQGQVVIEEAHL